MPTIEFAVDRAVLPDTIAVGARVQVSDGRVVAVNATDGSKRASVRRLAGTLLPGFVDLQVNGAGGRSVAEATPDALTAVARAVWGGGAVAFLPTLITAPWQQLLDQVAGVAQWLDRVRDATPADGARPLGLHVEGPFLEVPGAHDAGAFLDPTPARIDALLAAANGHLRLVTLASSRPGAPAAVARLRAAGTAVALGHVANPRGFDDCVANGAGLVTHLFNAMGPMHHREPGIAGLALDEDRLLCSLIVDGAHVHPAVVRSAFAVLGPDRTVLVTDATSAAGMADGEYRLSGTTVRSSGGVVRDTEGHLAGSALTMGAAAGNFLATAPRAGVWTLSRLCAANPAGLVGAADHGAIKTGMRADFALLDAEGHVQSVRC